MSESMYALALLGIQFETNKECPTTKFHRVISTEPAIYYLYFTCEIIGATHTQ